MKESDAMRREIEVLQARVAAQALVMRAALEVCSSGVIWLARDQLRELHDRVLPSSLSDAALREIQKVADELAPLQAAAEAREGLAPGR